MYLLAWIAIITVAAGAQSGSIRVASPQQQPRIYYHFPGEEDTLEFRYGFTVEETLQVIATDSALVMVDIRSPSEYAAGRVAGSINIPAGQITRSLSRFRSWEKAQRNIFLISSDGKEAKMWTSRLHRKGISRVWYVRGGIQAWQQAGHQLTRE